MDLIYRLNHLSPKRMTIFLTTITLTVPHMVLITGSTGSSGAEVRGISLIANLWMVRFEAMNPRFYFLDMSVFIISTPNLLFVVLV